MENFTQGEWWNSDNCSDIIAMASQLKIAKVHSVDQSKDQEQMRANAKLIAAAPDLFNSLRLCINLLYDTYADSSFSPTIKIAEKAIQKATLKRK